MRGATYNVNYEGSDGKFLSTLPVRGATHHCEDHKAVVLLISIHAPREGSDRGWTRQARLGMISIHAPREGSDGDQRARPPRRRHFYPRSP